MATSGAAGSSAGGASSVAASSSGRRAGIDSSVGRLMALEAASIRKAKQLEIEDSFKNDPESIDRCYVLLFGPRSQCDDVLDNSIPFSEHYKYLSRLPKVFLQRWIPSISHISEATIKEISRVPGEMLAKALCCGLVQELLDPQGPLDKAAWTTACAERHAAMGCIFDRLVQGPSGFDFKQQGIYHLVPPCRATGDEEREAHSYTGIAFLDGRVTVDFDVGFRANGSAELESNWSHAQAQLVRKGFIPEKVSASEFFKHDETFMETIRPLFTPAVKPKVCICHRTVDLLGVLVGRGGGCGGCSLLVVSLQVKSRAKVPSIPKAVATAGGIRRGRSTRSIGSNSDLTVNSPMRVSSVCDSPLRSPPAKARTLASSPPPQISPPGSPNPAAKAKAAFARVADSQADSQMAVQEDME